MLADRFATVRPDQWARTGFRSDGAAFTIDSFTRYMMHDPVHHVWDVRAGLRHARRRLTAVPADQPVDGRRIVATVDDVPERWA